MLIGHYAAAFAIKATRPQIPLWLLFVAVQFVDYLWAIFVLLGVEHVRIIEGFQAASNLDLHHMPYTHSLAAVFIWSFVAMGAYTMSYRAPWRTSLFVALAVFTHWLLDFVVHSPDLALYPGGAKVGLGIWDSLVGSQVLELGLLAAGMALYLRNVGAPKPNQRVAVCVLAAFFVIVQVVNLLPVDPAATTQALALSALGAYTACAILALLIDRLGCAESTSTAPEVEKLA